MAASGETHEISCNQGGKSEPLNIEADNKQEDDTFKIRCSNYMSVELATRKLLLSHEQLEIICHLLLGEFKRGLHRETNQIANVKMYPTHIRDQPQHYQLMGHFADPDEGKFLALDLGGTNFRVILVELEKDQFHMDNETYSLSRELMNGPGHELFDYIADCLYKFCEARKLTSHRLALGFTFSFPCIQDKLAHARLVSWTKGFNCSGVEGLDVVELLQEAIERRPDLDIEVMAVVNDTTGTLISCAYKNKECRVGLIVGTGTNACYMEDVGEVHAMQKNSGDSNEQQNTGPDILFESLNQQTTVVNTEWGAFGDNGILDFVRTEWDDLIDSNSVNPGRQKFEKMISGMYIGELCRLIMNDMALNKRILFQTSSLDSPDELAKTEERQESCGRRPKTKVVTSDETSQQIPLQKNSEFDHNQNRSKQLEERFKILTEGPFSKKFSFDTKFVSMIESDPVDHFEESRRALEEAFGIDWASDIDCASVKLICSRVTTRAAHLVSAAVACLLNRMARQSTIVGVDGSMFRFHPHFRTIMAKKTKELTEPEYEFQLMFSEDGSGRGAAIVAAVASKQRRISKELLERKCSSKNSPDSTEPASF